MKKLNIDISLNIDFPVFIANYNEIYSFFKNNESKFIEWIETCNNVDMTKYIRNSDIIPDEDYRYNNPYRYETWFDDNFTTFTICLTYVDREDEYSEYVHLSVIDEINLINEYLDLSENTIVNTLYTPEEEEEFIKKAKEKEIEYNYMAGMSGIEASKIWVY